MRDEFTAISEHGAEDHLRKRAQRFAHALHNNIIALEGIRDKAAGRLAGGVRDRLIILDEDDDQIATDIQSAATAYMTR